MHFVCAYGVFFILEFLANLDCWLSSVAIFATSGKAMIPTTGYEMDLLVCRLLLLPPPSP